MSFVPEDTGYKQYQGQIDPGFGPGPIGSKPPATVESKKAADARIIAMKGAEAMANKAIAGKGVQNPTVTPAAPPNSPITNKLNNLTGMLKGLPLASSVGTNPTYAAPPKPMPMPMPPTGTTGTPMPATGPQYMKKGGKVKSSSAKSEVSTASSRGDGIAQRGKTKGRMV
jgi:hypothetical protein